MILNSNLINLSCKAWVAAHPKTKLFSDIRSLSTQKGGDVEEPLVTPCYQTRRFPTIHASVTRALEVLRERLSIGL